MGRILYPIRRKLRGIGHSSGCRSVLSYQLVAVSVLLEKVEGRSQGGHLPERNIQTPNGPRSFMHLTQNSVSTPYFKK
jgi:hypothetical protein